MSINFKPINEVPVIDGFSDGDMVLVNSGGTAKQIDASKVGGGGGSAPVYLQPSSDTAATAYKDEAYTQMMTYAEGEAAAKNGAMWAIPADADEAPGMFYYNAALVAVPMGPQGQKMIMLLPGMMVMMGSLENPMYVSFSDTTVTD